MRGKSSLHKLAELGLWRSPDTTAFVEAATNAANANMRNEAARDVGRLGLAMLGIGGAARGATGLAGLLRNNLRRTAAPAVMTLPYPVADEEEQPRRKPKAASDAPAALSPGRRVFRKAAFEVTGKTALPWYRPAMLLAGMGGLYGGWKGVDAVLDAQRRTSREQELEEAKQEFHDALFQQYDRPLKSAPLPAKKASDAADGGPAPGDLCDRLGGVFDRLEKAAQLLKEGSRIGDIGGEAAGWYGTYAALSGLATGALVYEQARKRQRRAILDKALKRRERHRYYTAPPEIVAMPEPVLSIKKPSLKDEAQQLSQAPESELVETKLAGDAAPFR